MKNIWTESKKPLKILSPMAGYTDSAFRLLCREMGADIVMTELISADAIAYAYLKSQISNLKIKVGSLTFNKVTASKNNSTAELLSFFENERPLIVQLFGKYPEKFGIATKWITENLKPDGIDINMGCPARKVVGSDHGAALIKYPKLAGEIVNAVKGNTNLPVSVKTRLGWDSDEQIFELAPTLFNAGIDALIVHGRTYKNGFSGQARWENIYRLKLQYNDKIIIGNGDIKKPEEIDSRIYGKVDGKDVVLDGVAIGRGVFGKPWLFSKNSVGIAELVKIILKHAKLSYESKGEKGIIEFRKHFLEYLKGFPGAKALRNEAVEIKNMRDIQAIVNNLG